MVNPGYGDQMGAAQRLPEEGAVKRAEDALAHDVAVIGCHKAPAATQQELAQLGGRVGHVQMRDVHAGL
jgi:predicted lysophospholipase L1 biosynthesis ABC-type transport system permease subunit